MDETLEEKVKRLETENAGLKKLIGSNAEMYSWIPIKHNIEAKLKPIFDLRAKDNPYNNDFYKIMPCIQGIIGKALGVKSINSCINALNYSKAEKLAETIVEAILEAIGYNDKKKE